MGASPHLRSLGAVAVGGPGEGARDSINSAAALLRTYGLNDEQIKAVHLLYDAAGAAHTAADDHESHFAAFDKPRDFLYLGAALVCVTCAAIAAGLTLGLVSIDPLEMELKLRAGTDKEKIWASKILPLIKRHHLLLVTLLLFNATANEALPLFLDGLLPEWAAVVISVTMVLIFGEIVPSAVMTGPKQLQFSAAMATPTWGLICLFFPISYPLSVILDKCLGHESLRTYTRKELAELVKVQHETQSNKRSTTSSLNSSTHSLVGRGESELSVGSAPSTPSLSFRIPSWLRMGKHSSSDNVGGDDHDAAEAALTKKNSNRNLDGPHQSRLMPSLGRSMRSLSFSRGDNRLMEEEAIMLSSILQNAHTTVDRIMVPIGDVFSKDRNEALTPSLRKELAAAGFSRIPLTADGDPGNIRGFIHIKALLDVKMCCDEAEEEKNATSGGRCTATHPGATLLRDLPVYEPLIVGKKCELLVLLDKFKSGQSHLALVSEDSMATRACLKQGLPLRGHASILGIVTMEDVIEDLLMQDIQDESDQIRKGNINTLLRMPTSRNVFLRGGSTNHHLQQQPQAQQHEEAVDEEEEVEVEGQEEEETPTFVAVHN